MIMLRTLFIPEYDYINNEIHYCKTIDNEGRILNDYIEEMRSFLIEVCQFKDLSKPLDLYYLIDIIVLVTNGNLETQYGKACLAAVYYILNDKLSNDIQGANLTKYFYTTSSKRSDISLKIQNFLSIPADTRPGLSATSLWFHLCMTSAYATSAYLSHELQDKSIFDIDILTEDLVILRIAALFHDLGKPSNRNNHVNASGDIFKQFFMDIINPDLMNRIVSLISEQYQSGKEEYTQTLSYYIVQADRTVSGTENIVKIVKNLMADQYPWVNSEKFDEWTSWEQITPEEYQRISKEFVSFLYHNEKITKFLEEEQNSTMKEGPKKRENQISIVRGEARSIHEFIHGNRLDETKGGSLRISNSLLASETSKDETITNRNTAWIVLIDNILPLENIIFSGGGNILFISDTIRVPAFEEYIKQNFLNYVFNKTDFVIDHISFTFEETQINSIYIALLNKLQRKKYDLQSQPPKKVNWGYGNVCTSCLIRPAYHKSPFDTSGNYHYCTACNNLLNYGRNTAFKRVYHDYNGKTLTGLPWSDDPIIKGIRNSMSEVISESSARHSPLRLKNIIEQRIADAQGTYKKNDQTQLLDIAMISADGNNMGSFFSNILSINQLAEKSAKTRIAMDKAVGHTIDVVTQYIRSLDIPRNDTEAKITELRLQLGKILVAGDDILLMTPAILAIPFALLLGRTFYLEMGGPVTNVALGIGIVSGNPKTPLRTFIDGSENLLQNAKLRSRFEEKGMLYIDYEILKGSTFGKEFLSGRDKLWQKKLIARPFMIAHRDGIDFLEFFQIVINNKHIATLEDCLNYCLKLYYSERIEQKTNGNKPSSTSDTISPQYQNFKKILRVMRTVLSTIDFETPAPLDVISQALTFASYKKAKEKGDKDNIQKQLYTNSMKLLVEGFDENKAISLLDAYTLLKIFEGGIVEK